MNARRLVAWLLPAALLIAWEGTVRLLRVPELIVPSPLAVAESLARGLSSGYLLPHIGTTVAEVLLGLALGASLGFAAGVAMGESSFLRGIVTPYLVASQAVPKLALAPLFAIWFGFGMTSKVVITALICLFPMLESTVTAMLYADRERLELFRSLGASRRQTLLRCKLPGGLPELFGGLRVAVVLAVVGAVVGEFIGASKGLGAVIIASQGMMDTPLMFAALTLLTALGLSLYGLVVRLERRALRYRNLERRSTT
ncbi:ABC transporter permease [Paenibacillus sp. TRM 82003]|nr:ABC transporter permease [Paenibacillus sp. TRM 82003]